LDFSGSDLEICRFPVNQPLHRGASMFLEQYAQARVFDFKRRRRGHFWGILASYWTQLERRQDSIPGASYHGSSRHISPDSRLDYRVNETAIAERLTRNIDSLP
jgi:hypothetical protein